MEILSQQLKKGSLEIIVMQCLSEQDCYGYELISMLSDRSDGYYALREGSLYPVLYRLESKRYISHYHKVYEEQRKIPRKYYRITSEGQSALESMKRAWETHKSATERILYNGAEGGRA